MRFSPFYNAKLYLLLHITLNIPFLTSLYLFYTFDTFYF